MSRILSPIQLVLKALDRFFIERSRNAILVFSLVLALLIGAIDYHGASAYLIIYLAPIALAAWYGGWAVGAVISIYCTLAWFLVGLVSQGFNTFPTVEFWSALARLAVFVVLAKVISKLRESSIQQHEMMQFVVHDLRSPISSAITGLMTLQQLGGKLDETEQEMVNLALISNQRALTLVNSMLDVAKFESTLMEPNYEPVSLDELVSQAIQQVSLWAQTEGIQIEPDVQAPNACLDFDLTLRVLVNLLSNALKYSPPEGVVIVSVHVQFGGTLRFTVEDHGPGIPPEYLHSVFEPFTQVKGTIGGSGLGLTFCRLAIQAQGGKIWAESTLGKGAKMIFTLPSHEQSAATVTP